MLTNPPEEIVDFRLLSRLPGYTRRELDAEPAETVRRWLILLEELDAQEARQQRANGQS